MSLGDYVGRRVVVTGHSGFKGSWLTAWLKRLGAHVIGLSLPADDASLPTPNPAGSCTEHWGDVCRAKWVRDVMCDEKPSVVFHLAAQPLVRASYDDPVGTFAANVMGTVHVLQAARESKSVRAVVVVTSDKCYENNEWEWGYRENDPLGGRDPYSCSKGCAELVTRSFRQSFPDDMPVTATARAGNVIGGGDWAVDRIVPDIVRAVSSRRAVLLRRPNAVRPWQHVLDPLHGYLQLGVRLLRGDGIAASAWNFGPNNQGHVSVKQLTQRIIDAWGEGSMKCEPSASDVHEAGYLSLDCSKALRQLGWTPGLELQEVVDWTVQWYKTVLDASQSSEVSSSNSADRTAQSMTQQQIESFEQRWTGEARMAA